MKRDYISKSGQVVGMAFLLAAWSCPFSSAQQSPQTRPAETTPNQPVETRVFDVRDLVVPVPDFRLSTSPYAGAFLLPTGQSMQGAMGSGQNGQVTVTNQIFGGVAAPEPASPSKPASEELLKLIQDNVDSESWRDNGGKLGMIRDFRGMLVVTNTREALGRVSDLLEGLARKQGGM